MYILRPSYLRYPTLSPFLSNRPPPCFFFFNDTATTEISPLPQHDALPISKRVIMIMPHKKRKLPGAVAHLTSPGFVGGRGRQELSLRGGGPHRVITDMAVITRWGPPQIGRAHL